MKQTFVIVAFNDAGSVGIAKNQWDETIFCETQKEAEAIRVEIPPYAANFETIVCELKPCELLK